MQRSSHHANERIVLLKSTKGRSIRNLQKCKMLLQSICAREAAKAGSGINKPQIASVSLLMTLKACCSQFLVTRDWLLLECGNKNFTVLLQKNRSKLFSCLLPILIHYLTLVSKVECIFTFGIKCMANTILSLLVNYFQFYNYLQVAIRFWNFTDEMLNVFRTLKF